jgi:acyl-CoA synthetase (NDP forming)
VLGDAPADRCPSHRDRPQRQERGHAAGRADPQTSTQIPETAKLLGELSQKYKKPTFAAFMGDQAIRHATEILTEYSVPNYPVPERAVAAMQAMWHYHKWLETPPLQMETLQVDRQQVRGILDGLRKEGRATAGDAEARDILLAYGIPLPKTLLARNAEEWPPPSDRLPGGLEDRLPISCTRPTSAG